MNTTRPPLMRWLISAVAAVSVLAAVPAAAIDNLKILVPANPGGGWDQTGRGLAQAMQADGGVKSIKIENKGGAGGTIGLAQFINTAKNDPNALLIGGSVMVGGIILNKSPVNLSQVTPLARLTGEYDVLVVSADSPIRNMKQLIAKFKADPGSVSWGGGSAGGTDHIIVGMIAQAVGVDPSKINYVPFAGGGEAQAAIIGGHVTVGLSGWNEFAGPVMSGKMRPIGITSEKRLVGMRMPTLKEQGIDVVMANWRAVFAAPGITEAQKKELLATIDKTAKGDTWRNTMIKNQWQDTYMSGDEFRTFLAVEARRTEKIMEALGLIKKP